MATQEELLGIIANRDSRRASLDTLYYDMQTILAKNLEEAGVVKQGELQCADRRMKVRPTSQKF